MWDRCDCPLLASHNSHLPDIFYSLPFSCSYRVTGGLGRPTFVRVWRAVHGSDGGDGVGLRAKVWRRGVLQEGQEEGAVRHLQTLLHGLPIKPSVGDHEGSAHLDPAMPTRIYPKHDADDADDGCLRHTPVYRKSVDLPTGDSDVPRAGAVSQQQNNLPTHTGGKSKAIAAPPFDNCCNYTVTKWGGNRNVA